MDLVYPPQFQEHLFDPFFTTKPPGKGTGMGLSVSQAIIHDHNGEISFDSEPSSTRFMSEYLWPLATRRRPSTATH